MTREKLSSVEVMLWTMPTASTCVRSCLDQVRLFVGRLCELVEEMLGQCRGVAKPCGYVITSMMSPMNVNLMSGRIVLGGCMPAVKGTI
jgi:hypothetical protein